MINLVQFEIEMCSLSLTWLISDWIPYMCN